MQPISIPGAKQSSYDLLHVAFVCYFTIVSVLYSIIVLVMQGIVEDALSRILLHLTLEPSDCPVKYMFCSL